VDTAVIEPISAAAGREPSPGQVLLDKYCITRKLGEGGFGRVYEAREIDGGRRFALKVGRSRLHEERMAREARLAAAFEHRYSIRVFGLELLDDESPVIVMELLEGLSLREYLAMRGRVEVDLAVRWARQLAEVLQAAHSTGLVHRDLKPSNLFLVGAETGETEIRLLDFGLARCPEKASEQCLTESDVVVGSPAYLAPEVIRLGRASPRTDMWSFGVVLYELLAGRRPFRAETNAGLFAVIAADAPEPLALARPGLPGRLSRLVDRCLAKNPSDRPANMRAVLQTLTEIEGGDSTTATAKVTDPARPSGRRWVTLVCGLAAAVSIALLLSRTGSKKASAQGALPRTPSSIDGAESSMATRPGLTPPSGAPRAVEETTARPSRTTLASASARIAPASATKRRAGAAGEAIVDQPKSPKPATSEPLFLLTEPDY
jgi:serine/threonine protein kinase